jgi:hypothetical protein
MEVGIETWSCPQKLHEYKSYTGNILSFQSIQHLVKYGLTGPEVAFQTGNAKYYPRNNGCPGAAILK